MTTRVRRGASLLAVGLLSLLVLAGTAAAQAVSPVQIIRTDLTDFPTVRLGVAVSGDAAVTALTADDLGVTENGDPVDAQVTALSDQQIDVVLTIDVSTSMAGDPLAKAKVAALDLLDTLPTSARVAVVSFSTTADLRSGFTRDRNASRDAINGLAAEGGTAIYDAVALSAQQAASADGDRAAIVLLTDGADTSSTRSIDEAVSALGSGDALLYAVSLQTGDADNATLGQLADPTGGEVVSASDPNALTDVYVNIGERISNQYEVVFQSVTADPTATFAVTVDKTGDSASIDIALPNRTGPVTTEAAGPVAPPPRLTTKVSPAGLEQPWILWFGAVLIAAALAITAYVVAPAASDRPKRRSLRSDRVVDPEAGPIQRMATSVRDTATRFTSRAVERSEREGVIDASLDRAGLIMRAGEFVALVIGIALAAGFVLYLVMGPVGIAIGVLVPILGAPTALRFLASRRNAKFADQLSDTLIMMAGSLRSGFGLGATIDSVAQEMEAPIGVEFQRAILETRLGRDMEDALQGIAKRVQNEDFEWVVDAMRIHRQVGGDLAQILDQVSETIRARNRLRRQISALTAEGRLSGIVLACLPIGMGLILWTTNPDYLRPMFHRTAGLLMLAGGVALLVAGAAWLKKLVDVEL